MKKIILFFVIAIFVHNTNIYADETSKNNMQLVQSEIPADIQKQIDDLTKEKLEQQKLRIEESTPSFNIDKALENKKLAETFKEQKVTNESNKRFQRIFPRLLIPVIVGIVLGIVNIFNKRSKKQ